MKTWKIAAVFAALVFAALAAEMSGDYNAWLGYLSGKNSDGNRSTMQGAGAGGEASNVVRTDFIGAAAGAFSTNLTDCVGIGYRALRNSSDMNQVVAIGAGALTNRSGLTKATWINGQFAAFAQGNTFWLKANPDTPNTNAPIYYADGVLHLRAEIVDINGSIATNIPGGASGGTSKLDGYDLYVDPENGSDLYSGRTPTSAKQTIDAAYSLVTTNGTRICLLPGVHTSPSYEANGNSSIPKPYRVWYVAPYGPDKTIIDGGGVRSFIGSSTGLMTVEGCTLRDFTGHGYYCPPFDTLYFRNCIFAGEVHRRSYKHFSVIGCVFEGCRFEAMFTVDSTGQDYPRFASMFYSCDVFDSVFMPTYTNTPVLFNYSSRFENCFIYIPEVQQFDSLGDTTVLGNSPGYMDATAICPSSSSFGNLPFSGCLLGFNSVSNAPSLSRLTNTVLTNAETIASAIGANYRPAVTSWRFRYNGCGSAADRAVRNSLCNSVMAALAEEDAVIATNTMRRAALMAAIAENEEADAPSSANRDWNSYTNGLLSASIAAQLEDPEDRDE